MSIKAIQGVGERLVVLRDNDELWICHFAHWGDMNQGKLWSKLEVPWAAESGPTVEDEDALLARAAETMRQEFKAEALQERAIRLKTAVGSDE